MWMLYYADRISDNIRKREPEGYLICVNVPIARSGIQKYLNDELERSGDVNEEVDVLRPEEEVFSDATMASFEGMPVTNDHPNDSNGVTADNIRWLQKGHCQNVRRGTGSEKNMLIADLVITDPDTIKAVMDGKREISCGYNYELSEENGKLVQRAIRGNHVAIVDQGRAGHRVAIKDSAPKTSTERRKTKMAKTKHGVLAKMLARYAKDADPEEVAEAVEAIDEIVSEEPKEEEATKATDAEVHEKLDKIMDVVENLQTPTKEEEDEEPEEVPAEEAKDEGPDKQDIIIDLLKKLVEKQGSDCGPKRTKDEEPDELQKLEEDIDEMAEDPKTEEETEDEEPTEGEEEETFAPDEDPDEMESHFVAPEKINEEDSEEEPMAEKEYAPTVMDRKARDAMKAAIRAVKPMIAMLPPRQRKIAADAAARSIRKSYGMSGKATKNNYTAIKQATMRRKASDSAKNTDSDESLGKKIMERRNANYKK